MTEKNEHHLNKDIFDSNVLVLFSGMKLFFLVSSIEIEFERKNCASGTELTAKGQIH